MIYRGINPIYGPYISHLERNRMEMAMNDYKEELLSAARIYEDQHRKTVGLDSVAAHHSSVPDPFGYQASPDLPTAPRTQSMTKVTPTAALKQLLSEHAPYASAQDMARLERLFPEITTGGTRSRQGMRRPHVRPWICYNCDEEGHKAF